MATRARREARSADARARRTATGTTRASEARGEARWRRDEAKGRRSRGRRALHAVLDESEDLAVERGGARGTKALGGGETAVGAEEVRLERVGAELDRG